MAPPVLADARAFFADDVYIAAMSDARINYWISDIVAKDFIDPVMFGKLYFNAFMNMLGHYLILYETNIVSYRGGITSETTAQVSRSFNDYKGDNKFQYELSLTKYGIIYASLQDRLAVTRGGFVAGSNFCFFCQKL